MKIIADSYGFDPIARKVSILGQPSFNLERVVMVTNVTLGIVIYSYANSTLGGTLDGSMLTLEYDTSAMSASDRLQIVLELPAPAKIQADPVTPLLGDSGEQLTRDVQLAALLGSNPLIDAQSGGVKATGRVAEMSVRGALGALGQSLICYCSGYPTVGLQLSGTFTGTVVFEASVDGANWVGVFGVPVAGGTLAASTTAVGAWLISVAGCTAVRARASAAVTGAATVVFVASAAVALSLQAAGSLAALSQRATSLELNTYDTNLVAVFGTASLARNPATDIAIGPVAPPAKTAAQLLAAPTWTQGTPQIFPRARVEAGGSERLPLRQEPHSNALVVASDDIRRQLETVSVQLAQLTEALAAAGLIGEIKC